MIFFSYVHCTNMLLLCKTIINNFNNFNTVKTIIISLTKRLYGLCNQIAISVNLLAVKVLHMLTRWWKFLCMTLNCFLFTYLYIHIYISANIYIYIYMCVYTCNLNLKYWVLTFFEAFYRVRKLQEVWLWLNFVLTVCKTIAWA